MPRQTLLSAVDTEQSIVIGRRIAGKMEPDRQALEVAAGWLTRLCDLPKTWIFVDEIGFLEEASSAYQQALWSLFQRKRVLAVLRKSEHPFLRRIAGREDAYLLDLDAQEEWE